MEIIEKIQLLIDDLDQKRLMSIGRTCADLVARFRLDLTFCGEDQSKLEFIQSRQKETQEKVKEMGMKAHYAVDLYEQHLEIEFKKEANCLPFNIPVIPNDTSIFKVEIIRLPDADGVYIEVDHVECALINAQKVSEEFIVWTIFYSELEDMEQEIHDTIDLDRKNELAETISSVKDSGVEMKIEKSNQTALPENGTIVSSKYLQIFKEEGAELFDFFQNEYTLDDQSPVAKYSYIYHFLVYEQLITARSQLKYMEFIKEFFGITMSKILPENDKFKDDIHRLLSRLKSNFEKRSKFELN